MADFSLVAGDIPGFTQDVDQGLTNAGVNTTGFSYQVSSGSIIIVATGPRENIAVARQKLRNGLVFIEVDGQDRQAVLGAQSGGDADDSMLPVAIVLVFLWVIATIVLLVTAIIGRRRTKQPAEPQLVAAKQLKSEPREFFFDDDVQVKKKK